MRPGLQRRQSIRRAKIYSLIENDSGPVFIFSNEDLASIPVSFPYVPPELLSGGWQMTITPNQGSATLPNDFGFVSVMAFNDEHAVVLRRVDTFYRLDVYAGGVELQIGVMEWTGTPAITLYFNPVTGAITAEGVVTFGDGWDSTGPTSASKTIAPWVWAGTTTQFGGFLGLFAFDGTIQDVVTVP